MKHVARVALLSVLAFTLIQAAPRSTQEVFANATTPSTIKNKKRKKHKKNKEVIPKIRPSKHSRKPA